MLETIGDIAILTALFTILTYAKKTTPRTNICYFKT